MPAGERAKGLPLQGATDAPFDPQALIGVWSGRMNSIDNASVNVKMVLTIERVTDALSLVGSSSIRTKDQ